MKNFILIIILLLPVNIYAKEYYTNYIYEKESPIKETESNLIKIEKSRCYRTASACLYLKLRKTFVAISKAFGILYLKRV